MSTIKLLKDLVIRLQNINFDPGDIVSKSLVLDLKGGSLRKGISVSASTPNISIFISKRTNNLYTNALVGDTFHLEGEGLYNDMDITKGSNKALKEAAANKRCVTMYQCLGKGKVLCLGEVIWKSYQKGQGLDKNGRMRKTITHVLSPKNNLVLERLKNI